MNAMPKYVASTTPKSADWNNSTIIQADVAAAAAKLKKDLKGDILVTGSRSIVTLLKHHGLINEYRFMVFPIVLRSGMRLLADTPDAKTLKLVSSEQRGPDVMVLTYVKA
jgi:dihydrofolate reductase